MSLTDFLVQVKHEMGIKWEFSMVLFAFALLMARVLPVVLLTPMIGGETTPTEVKFGLGVLIGLVLFPAISPSLHNIPIHPLAFIAFLVKEIFVGYSMAFIVGIIFDAANVGGQLVDNMSGTNMAQIHVPSLQQQVSIYAGLKLQLVITLFLTLNGHHLVIQAFADSFTTVPIDGFPKFSTGFWPFFDLIARVFGDMMRIALAISAPVLLATFLTDLALGMINRVAPQVQVFFVSMQIKPAVAILILFTSVHLIMSRVSDEYSLMFHMLRRAIHLLG
jgi:flagellar biosynthetic protein FliR